MALTMATKFYLDRYEKNTFFYGAVVGMDKRYMRVMTDAFINMMEFEFYISDQEYSEAIITINDMVKTKFF